jgi:hypothetical protein
LIGLVLGIIAGLFLGELAAVFKIIGDVFIRLFQVTVIPYISLSLITGLGSLGFDTVKLLAVKGGQHPSGSLVNSSWSGAGISPGLARLATR